MRNRLSNEMASYTVKIDPEPSQTKTVYIQVEGKKEYHSGETIELNSAPKEITIRRETGWCCIFTTWRCRYVTITSSDTEKEYYFPVFGKINSAGLTVKENSAKLPYEDDSEERKESKQKNEDFLDSIDRHGKGSLMTANQEKSSCPNFHDVLLWFVSLFLQPFRVPQTPGVLDSVYRGDFLDLPRELQFGVRKLCSVIGNTLKSGAKYICRKLWSCRSEWRKIDDIKHVFLFTSKKAEYISQKWKDDAFFGEQVLNGCNPIMIKRYSVGKEQKIPLATLEKVYPDIKENIQNGNIYVVDYEILDDIQEDASPKSPRYLAAPVMLLQQMENDLKPIAIQLKQRPGVDNPVFTPKDKDAWLLAKMWVRNSDFSYHEFVSHLLRAHLMAEIFFIASFCLADQHPMAKLLLATGRYTIPINIGARGRLINPGGYFTEFTAITDGGLQEILRRAGQEITYESICLPDNLADRDVNDLKNYYYRDDAMEIWNAIYSFVHDVVIAVYKDDGEVCEDPELGNMVYRIYNHGFQRKSGPSALKTREEAVKYITMIMFTCSAQHAAVNHGQYDTYAWMPNGPTKMRKPAPTNKEVTEKDIMDTLPEINVTLKGMAVAEILSQVPDDFVPLGEYPEELTCERHMRDAVCTFRKKLKEIGEKIERRSKSQEFPYEYLYPATMENSISI